MKICMLAHSSSVLTHHWVQFLRDRGHEVVLVSLTGEGSIDSIEHHVLRDGWPLSHGRTNWQHLLALPRLWVLLRRLKPDLVNAQFLSSSGFLAALACPRGCALVQSVQGSDVLLIPNRSRLHAWSARFALSRADLVTSPAEHLSARVRELGVEAASILTCQYGVRSDLFFPPASEVKRPPVVLSARSLVSLADLPTILEAMERPEIGSDLRLDIVGDGPERTRLERVAGDLIARQQVRFLGAITQEALAAKMRQSALYVSMTSSDGASMTLLEAMACGTFPVVSDIAANREWITDGSNGFLVPLGSPDTLAERLHAAWRDEALRRAAAERNRHIVREKADYERNTEKIEVSFRRLMDSTVKSPAQLG